MSQEEGPNELLGHWLFKSPEPARAWSDHIYVTNRHVRNHVHGIPSPYGHEPAWKVKMNLRSALNGYTKIYSKGHEVCHLLTSLIDHPVIDLADLGCPSIRDIIYTVYNSSKPICPLESHACTRLKTRLLREWLNDNHKPDDVCLPTDEWEDDEIWDEEMEEGEIRDDTSKEEEEKKEEE